MSGLDLSPLIARAEEMRQLIDEESERLLREGPSDLAELVARKQMMTNDFNHQVRQILGQREALAETPREIRETLREALARFDASVIRNGTILLRLKQNVEGLLQAVALERAPVRAGLYGPGKAGSRPPAPTALAINASI